MLSKTGNLVGMVAIVVCGVCSFEVDDAAAITLFQTDDFQDGTTQGWGSGGPNPNPPTNIADGGPAGVGDSFLQITSTGGGGPGSNLVAFNTAQWSGDYLGAEVNAISAFVNNIGSNPLELRVAINGAGGMFSSTIGVSLPVASGWQQVVFPIDPVDFTSVGGSDVNATLSDVSTLRFLHNTSPSFNGSSIVATLGIDNITATTISQPVPEPHTILGTGIALGLGALSLKRKQKKSALAEG